MSECVVRMEMPQNCFECPFSVFDNNGVWCNVLANKVYGYYERDEDCPIICQLPEGHGDLIDRDVLLQTFQNADYETYNDYCEAFDTTEAAETIVPAETKRSET